ncbi:MAG: transporter substrate-binding domain-containing protein [Pseudomonadota bacterium]|nr:transporter substrate-binding domain-containing protein [Pseudomonadota bacterium]
MIRAATLFSCVVWAALSACADFPRDAEGTLREVQQGRPLTVGWSSAAPWVRSVGRGEPVGIEPDIIRRWASERGMRIQWVEASEGQIVEGLNGNSLDVGIAGFTDQAPHGGLIGQTQPYLQPRVVIARVPGAAVPSNWEGVGISYDPARPEFAALLREHEAIPTAGGAQYRLLYEPELARAGLVSTGKTLRTDKRTIATAPSENALTLALDEFLHANKPAIEARLAQEGRR